MGPKEQAQDGLRLLKQAIHSYIALHPEGVTNADVTTYLGLESDFEGSQKNYLAWSIIGLLVSEGKIKYEKHGRSKLYFNSQ